MVDPNKVTKFDRTNEELEEFFVYSVCVANRQAQTVSRQLDELLAFMRFELRVNYSPFALLNFYDQNQVAALLKQVGVGCMTQKAEALTKAAGLWVADKLDLRTCTVEQLEEIRWVGPKTARFFVLHSREGVRVAAIDTHILKHLTKNGVKAPSVPPPKGKAYLRLEQEFLALADKAGVSPAEYDLQTWKEYST